ncbi:site-2 protease family protein [Caldilinea sp.]|uniref:site-2 protease family protein n=1 Tax=Caldilinea sp. TaxID=2293560 RepID=UPI002C10AAE7|nr:site-2 protease family protein [Anaerolineales bacterium]HQY91025.1 site-2 protease family protein [Caldilinea sp.]HRA64430.1 site-2 protease family protein [Caldilinea sp.]
MSELLPPAVAAPPISPPPSALIQNELRSIIEPDLLIESIQAPRDPEKQGVLLLRGRLLRPSHVVFPRWQAALARRNFTPTLRSAAEEHAATGAPLDSAQPDDVYVRILPGVARPGRPRVWINAVLFVLTVISTLFVGSLYGDTGLVINSAWDFLRPENLMQGLPFAATLLSILAAHEFGHYFAARYHKVAVTLPYFIPMPLTFGTLGAFIQLKEPIPDRRKLFDIGVAGPLAGLALAAPLLFIGLASSVVSVPPPAAGLMVEGNSIFYLAAKFLVFGEILPNAATGRDVMMNQITFAAWIGLLVTALNLLPVGQLDGGHTVFAMFGRKARYANLATVGLLTIFALAGLPFVQQFLPIIGSIGYPGWFLWLFLILVMIGVEHPPALDDVTTLDTRRRIIGFVVILIFILTFVPVPMRVL